MAERLTKKQVDFIAACHCQIKDGFDKHGLVIRTIPFYFGPVQWDDWGMRSKSAAEAFVQRLLDRRLIRTDKQFFYWITAEGRAVIDGVRADSKTAEGTSHES